MDRLAIPYMVTGSIASSLQGEPRASHDIDLVVEIKLSVVDALVAAFPPPAFYLDKDAILDALARQGMFNLIDVRSGDKVDFWVLTDDAFDQCRFARRHTRTAANAEFQVSRPEDTILMKLRWAEMSGGSAKQFTDALRVYEVQFAALDINYLTEWVGKLGLAAAWRQLQQAAAVSP